MGRDHVSAPVRGRGMIIYPVEKLGKLTLYRRDRKHETWLPLYTIYGRGAVGGNYGEYATLREARKALKILAKAIPATQVQSEVAR